LYAFTCQLLRCTACYHLWLPTHDTRTTPRLPPGWTHALPAAWTWIVDLPSGPVVNKHTFAPTLLTHVTFYIHTFVPLLPCVVILRMVYSPSRRLPLLYITWLVTRSLRVYWPLRFPCLLLRLPTPFTTFWLPVTILRRLPQFHVTRWVVVTLRYVPTPVFHVDLGPTGRH